jgi:DNA-binding cell septation regulator SpoVG
MARQKEESTETKKDWIIYDTDFKYDFIRAQITYVTGDKEGTIAYGQVTFKDVVAIKAGLVHSKGGHDFWSFPSKKGKDGNWYSDVIPMNKKVAAYLKELAEECIDYVLDEYEEPKKEKNKRRR